MNSIRRGGGRGEIWRLTPEDQRVLWRAARHGGDPYAYRLLLEEREARAEAGAAYRDGVTGIEAKRLWDNARRATTALQAFKDTLAA